MDSSLFIIVRHAYAGTREGFKKTSTHKTDDQRPLTKKGKKDALLVGAFLKKIEMHEPTIYTSPYVRTAQTAEAIQKKLGKKATIVDVDALKPHVPMRQWQKWFRNLDFKKTNVMVGHEPTLSKYLGYLLTTKAKTSFDIKKSTVIVLRIKKHSNYMRAELKCYLQVSDLKNLIKK